MNTEKKAVFFDADGTICDMKRVFQTVHWKRSAN